MEPDEPVTPESLQKTRAKMRLLIGMRLLEEIFSFLYRNHPQAFESLLKNLPDIEERIKANKAFPLSDSAKAALYFDEYEENTNAFFSVLLKRINKLLSL